MPDRETSDPPRGDPPGALRSTVLRGGAFLIARQGAGMVIAIIGTLALTRIIGPAQYGLYAAALGIFLVAQLIAQLGVNVFLIRQPAAVDEVTRGTATSLLSLAALFATILLVAAIPLIERVTRLDGIARIALAVFVTLPVAQLGLVPQALLDRSLSYARIAQAELAAQAAFVLVALAVAWERRDAWALVAGWWVQQTVLVSALHWAARQRPTFRWQQRAARAILAYGVPYTISSSLFQLRRLVNPVIVGRFAGAEAVAIVSVTSQIVNQLSFIAVATWRLAHSALARVQNEAARLASAVNEGMRLQVLAVAPCLLTFAFLGPLLVEPIMGARWAGILTVFPFLALVSLTTSLFNLHASALHILKQNWAMAEYHAAHTAVLTVAALVLVPSVGLLGYGIAEVATMITFFVLHMRAARFLPGLSYTRVAIMIGGVTPALFFHQLGLWSLLAPIAMLLLIRPWREYGAVIAQLRGLAA